MIIQTIQYRTIFIQNVFAKAVFCCFIICICSCSVFAQSEVKKEYTVVVSNTQSFERKNEIIAISRSSFTAMQNNLVPVIKNNAKLLISQLIDQDKDGKWDKLLIEVNLAALSKDTLHISFFDQQPSDNAIFANIRFSLKTKTSQPSPEIETETRIRGFKQNIADPYYQLEGPGIENDKVAFRAFFDYRNGKDIYGKIIDTPILKEVGVKASWHNLQPWGMDILKVGNSLGAGALAIKENSSLIRLADADTTRFFSLYKGALSAAFKLMFSKWDVGKLHKNGSETVSITKGDFFYKNEISVPLNKNQQLVSGIANFGIDQVVFTRHNASFSSIATFGKQAEGTDTNLGLAILFDSNDYIEYKSTQPGDTIPNTTYVVLKHRKNKGAIIYFVACWEKTDPRFKTENGFRTYLKETANRLANPIQIKFIKKLS